MSSVLNIKFTRAVIFLSKYSTLRFLSTASLYDPKPKFDWEDPLNFDKLIHDDERAIRDSVKTYCREKLLPRVVESFRNAIFDRKIYNEMAELGIIGSNFKGYGCAGTSNIAYGLICRELEKIDSCYRSIITIQDLSIATIIKYGSKEQQQQYLPRMVKGELIACWALTEPNFGSDAGGIETIAKYDAKTKTYKITGTKTWIANSPIADIFIIWAKTKDGKVTGFIIEKDKAKHDLHTLTLNTFSLRSLPMGKVLLKEVVVPEENLLLDATRLRGPFTLLDHSRYGVSWGALGVAESCLQIARQYTLDRTQFGKPLASFQLIQKKLADMATEIALGFQACIHVGRLKDQNLITPEMMCILKRNNTAKALSIARNARDILGGNGISDEYHVIRHLLNLESVSTYEGTHDILSLMLGRAITGIQAFR